MGTIESAKTTDRPVSPGGTATDAPHWNAKEFWIRDVTLSNILDFAYIFDKAGRFLYINKPLLDLWGLTLSEAVGRNFFDLNYPVDLAEKLQRQIQQVFDSGQTLSDETPYTSPSGHPGFYEYIFTPVLGQDGVIEAVAGSTRDITRRKRAELNLAFLASISQDLAALGDVDEMMSIIGAKIGKYLRLTLCTFVEINERADQAVAKHEWRGEDVPSLVGVYQMADYLTDDFQKAGRAGETFVVRNTETDPRTDTRRYAELKIGAFACVPLVRDGQWRFMLCIYHSEPYEWPEDELALIQDVTARVWSRLERVRAENALKVSNAASEKQRRLYDTILSNNPDLIYVFDLTHRFTYANDALLKMWGRTWEEAIGKNCLELGYEPWHAEMHDREIDQVVATKKPIRGEVPFAGTNGRRIYDYIFVPVLDSKGSVEAITGTTRDVTERKRAEAAEQAERKVFELMATGASLPETLEALVHQMEALATDKMFSSILLLDETGQKLLHGAAPSLSGAFNQAIHGLAIGPKAGACGTAAFERRPVFVADLAADPRCASFTELARTHGLGACCSMPIFSSEKELLGTVAMYYPQPQAPSEYDRHLIERAARLAAIVIERKRMEKTSRENAERFRALADNISQLAWMADASGAIFWYNRRWFEFTGTTLEEMKGWGWQKVQHPDHTHRVTEKWSRHLQEGQNFEDTFPLRSSNGEYRWFLTRAFPIRDAQGKITLWFGTNTDITDLRAAQDAVNNARTALADQNKNLEQIVQQRTLKLQETITELESFSYSISHDMRSPLRAMQGYADALLHDHGAALNDEAIHYLQRINHGANRLELLLRDVLTYSKVAKGDLQLKRIDVEKLIVEIVQSYDHLDPSRIRVEVKPIPNVMGHEGLLTQVISNILGNAVKFTKPGTFPFVAIDAETVQDQIVISFRDNGIGIAAKDYGEIFKIFGRVYPEKQYEGTGIGLAIVKKACERMGGSVGVESELGKGSRFWISLPNAV